MLKTRESDPVVLEGKDIQEMIGRDPKLTLGFVWHEDVGFWTQVCSDSKTHKQYSFGMS